MKEIRDYQGTYCASYSFNIIKGVSKNLWTLLWALLIITCISSDYMMTLIIFIL